MALFSHGKKGDLPSLLFNKLNALPMMFRSDTLLGNGSFGGMGSPFNPQPQSAMKTAKIAAITIARSVL
jgi:hypothetical protein